MSHVSKFLWSGLGLAFAGVVGYEVASFAIGDLNKRVLDAAQALGRVQATTQLLQDQGAGLQTKQGTIEQEVKDLEARLANVLQSDTAGLVRAIEVLNGSPEVKQLIGRFEAVVKTVPKSVVFSCSEPEGFKDAGINTTIACPEGALVSGMTFGNRTSRYASRSQAHVLYGNPPCHDQVMARRRISTRRRPNVASQRTRLRRAADRPGP